LSDNTEILKEIKKVVLEVDSEAKVILFGSRARGDFNDESDWDVLILVDKEETDFTFKRKLRNALLRTQLRFGEAISTIIRNRSFWNELKATPFYREVQKDGVAL
jgi:predicted nucleotidyltransferase